MKLNLRGSHAQKDREDFHVIQTQILTKTRAILFFTNNFGISSEDGK
jgi:hypothetical protein